MEIGIGPLLVLILAIALGNWLAAFVPGLVAGIWRLIQRGIELAKPEPDNDSVD